MATHQRLCIVVAVAENGVIGNAGALPWRLKSDLARFRQLTLGKAVIMGRKTFDSIGKPLPGRHNIVVTRQPNRTQPGVTICPSLDDALQVAETSNVALDPTEIMIIGGAEIFRALLPSVDRIYLTRVHGNPPGDTHMPELDLAQWRLVGREFHAASAGDEFDWTLETLDRA